MPIRLPFLIVLGACLLYVGAVSPVQADRAKPRLLDGDLIEEGQSPPPVPQPAPEPVIDQTVTLLKEFTLSLPVNPRSGLVWRLADHDRQFLQLLRHRYQKPDPTKPGTPGRQHFDFLPLKSGRTTLTFVAQPPLVRTVAQERRFTIIIK